MIGVFDEFGVFENSGVFEGDVTSDPLAGITFVARLQTHIGDNIPVGLYQDSDFTIPAVEEGDPIGGWRDEVGSSGFSLIQEDDDARPILHYNSNGNPTIQTNGDDQWLYSESSIPDIIQCVIGCYFQPGLVAALAQFGKYDMAATMVMQLSDTGVKEIASYDRSLIPDEPAVYSSRCSVDLGDVAGWIYLNGELMDENSVSQESTATGVTLASAQGSFPAAGEYTSLFLFESLSDSTRSRVENYAETLQ